MRCAVITCTGGRQELLSLCERWVGSQTTEPDVWIVSVDDGSTPELSREHRLIRPPERPEWWPSMDVAAPKWNLYWALSQVPAGHAAIVMEDDDYYSPSHISECLRGLESQPFSVQPSTIGFHLPNATWSHCVTYWPTEGLVAVHPDHIATYQRVLALQIECPFPGIYTRPLTCVQIKGAGRGLPGRAGLTRWQMDGAAQYQGFVSARDPGYTMFSAMVGRENANRYLSLLR